MKDVNRLPKYEASKFMDNIYNYLEAKMFFSAIDLKVFDYFSDFTTVEEFCKKTNYDKRNSEIFLRSLVSIGLLSKSGDYYLNSPEAEYYLNSKRDMYLGDNILYWKDMTSLENLNELLVNGAKEVSGSEYYDFDKMANGNVNAAYTGRVQNFFKTVKELFDIDSEINVLDLGGGSGVLSIEIADNFGNSKVKIFDQEDVFKITRIILKERKLSENVELSSGDFNTDDFGSGYDLIIASGVFEFFTNIDEMCKKLYDALNENGYLYFSSHGINDELTGPKRFILGWLSGNLNGVTELKPNSVFIKILKEAGFKLNQISDNKLNYIFKK